MSTLINFTRTKTTKNFVKVAQRLHPLYELLKHSSKWHCMKEREHAFTKTKQQIINMTMLYRPDLTKSFNIQTDVSAIAVGWRLYQENINDQK